MKQMGQIIVSVLSFNLSDARGSGFVSSGDILTFSAVDYFSNQVFYQLF